MPALRQPEALKALLRGAIGFPITPFAADASVDVAGVRNNAAWISHYGLCALVNLLPMPQFFAGLLPTWESALGSLTLLGTIAMLSSVYPASRAASVDPIEALRMEVGG